MPKYNVFAAIELGSTDIMMKIAQMSKTNGISIIDSVRYSIATGPEVYRNGRISYSTVDKICSALSEFVRIMNEYGVQDYSCYATTAVREAENSEFFIDQVNIRCGIKVSIISNEEEIFLHNKALALNTQCFDDIIEDGAVIIDVNSGNTQVSFYEKSKLKFSQRIPIGAMRMLEILAEENNDTSEFAGLLEEFVKTNINNYKNSFFKITQHKYIVTLFNNMNILKHIGGIDGDMIDEEQIKKIYKLLRDEKPQDISDKYNIPYDEAELLFPTVLIHKMFIEKEINKTIVIPEISLADGMCVEYAEKNVYTHTNHIFTNDIISSAQYYAGRYEADEKHYKQVIEFAQVIFSTMSKKAGLSKKDLLTLKVAAIFADTGKYINIIDYNKYSYDIVKSNPILGITRRNHEIISYVVLMQNGLCENQAFNYMPKNRKLLVSKLSAILSIAQALDIEYNQKILRIRAAVKPDGLHITACCDREITVEKIGFRKRAEFFEEVFGIKVYLNKGAVK